MSWPNKVWEPTGTNKDGITLWSSRPVTKEDIKRRKQYDMAYAMRVVNRELKDKK